jgi:Ca-activated chloride channel family protein
MTSLRGAAIPLQGVHLSGAIDAGLLELTVEQRYRNLDAVAIEAVYTFPLPLDAVLLSFELAIGERRLQGVVNRKREAAEAYENAIESGDTAALLEQSRDGLYTVSIGNLAADEAAVVRFRFAQLLDFDAGRIRAAIPTAVAPRYGQAEQAVAAHQVPVTDLQAEYPLSLQLAVRGPLAQAPISSPTHTLVTTAGEDQLLLSLSSNATLDRDLVILIDQVNAPAQGLVARDGDAYVGLISLTAPAIADARPAPHALKLLVDCSGSMGGPAIAQAAIALQSALASLQSGDHVSLTRFGSEMDAVTPGLQPITPALRRRLHQRCQTLQADLGGTELEAAIDAVLAIAAPPSTRADVLLITDGEVWELDALLDRLADTGQRLFVIAVSTTPVEELARKVASITGGACEFVTPGEDMQAAVARQLQRMGASPSRVLSVDWGVPTTWTAGLQRPVYPGDTVHLIAGFNARPERAVQVRIGQGEHDTTVRRAWSSDVATEDTLPRLGTARRLPTLPPDTAAALAEQYALVTAWTSCVVVLVRPDGEKATDAPALRRVPQMMAAGHAGAGNFFDDAPMVMDDVTDTPGTYRTQRQRRSAPPVRAYAPTAAHRAIEDQIMRLDNAGRFDAFDDSPETPLEHEELARHTEQMSALQSQVVEAGERFQAENAEHHRHLAEAMRQLDAMRLQTERSTQAFHKRMDQLQQQFTQTRAEINRCRLRIEGSTRPAPTSPASFSDPADRSSAALLQRLAEFVTQQRTLPRSFSDLRYLGVAAETLASLQHLVDQGHQEDDVVIAWLTEVTGHAPSPALDARLHARLARAAQRALRKLVTGLFP